MRLGKFTYLNLQKFGPERSFLPYTVVGVKVMNRMKWWTVVGLLASGAFSGAQALLNEKFDGPGLPGWSISGETSPHVRWDVSGGTFNLNGVAPGIGSAGMELRRPLVDIGSPGPTSWEFERGSTCPLPRVPISQISFLSTV